MQIVHRDIKYSQWMMQGSRELTSPVLKGINALKLGLTDLSIYLVIYLSSNPWLRSFEYILRWGATILSLPCCDIQSVSCPLQQSLKTHTKTWTELHGSRLLYMTLTLTF